MTEIKNAPDLKTAAIAEAVPVKRLTPSAMMKAIVNNTQSMEILRNALNDHAGAFAASVIDLYGSDTYLQKCDARKVFQECLKAVSLNLPINKQLGFAWVIPYKDNKTGETLPQFQLGYKGIVQLCMRTGAYRCINADCVYEGESVVTDRLRGTVEITGEATGGTVTGYFAYIETINGFGKAYYWTREKVIEHAKKYSKSYNAGAAIWKEHFDEMAQKTVLSNLLHKWGLMSVEFITQDGTSPVEAALADDIIVNGDEE